MPVDRIKLKKDLNDFALEIASANTAKGFWPENDILKTSFPTKNALMHSELSEALEADRNNTMDQHLSHRSGVEVELADALIRILDWCGKKGLDIGGAVVEKLAFNETRPTLHGGKAY